MTDTQRLELAAAELIARAHGEDPRGTLILTVHPELITAAP